MTGDFDAVILAGGRGRRAAGRVKPLLESRGMTLLERVVRAAVNARRIVVVGGDEVRRGVEGSRSLGLLLDSLRVSWTLESPPFGGPLRALAAGVSALPPSPAGSDLPVVLLPADLADVTAQDVFALLTGLAGSPPAVVAEAEGQMQWAFAAALRSVLDDSLAGSAAVRRGALSELWSNISCTPVRLPSEACADIDTLAELLSWESGERTTR